MALRPNRCLQFAFVLFLLVQLVPCQNENDVDDAVAAQFADSTSQKSLAASVEPVDVAPSSMTNDVVDEDLAQKLDELDAESQHLVVDFARNGRKFNGDIRRRLVMYVLDFAPVQKRVELLANPNEMRQIERIKHRFRTGLRLKYSTLKLKVDRLVAHLLAPIFAPFLMVQPDEIRPMLPAPRPDAGNIDRFAAPIVEAPQPVSNPQSSFIAQEFFPSSLPASPWPQLQPQWLQPSTPQQFGGFTPYYYTQQRYFPYPGNFDSNVIY